MKTQYSKNHSPVLLPMWAEPSNESGPSRYRLTFGRKLLFLFSALTLILQSTAPALAQTVAPTISTPSEVSTSPIGDIPISAPAGTVYYTLDGSVPSSGSTVYRPYGVSADSIGLTQVNAIAINDGVSSSVTSAYYFIDNDFNFISIPNSWYLNCFGPAVSGAIPIWPDLVSASNATQTTTANQPTYLPTAINELPAIQFSGSANYQLPSTTFTNAGVTIFMVANPTTLTANAQLLNYAGATPPQNLIALSENSSNEAQFSVWNGAGTSSTTVSAGIPLAANQYQLIEAVQGDINSTTATLYVNGVQAGQNTAMNLIPAASLTNNYMGQSSSGGQNFVGNLAEVMLFLTPLTTSQRVAIESYLLSKYQILSQVPTAPVISTSSATFSQPTQVAISAQPGSTIRFTLDGTVPSVSSPEYSRPILINYTQTLKAIAIQNSMQSSVTTATYTLNSTQWPAPSTGGPSLQINLTAPSLAIP